MWVAGSSLAGQVKWLCQNAEWGEGFNYQTDILDELVEPGAKVFDEQGGRDQCLSAVPRHQ